MEGGTPSRTAIAAAAMRAAHLHLFEGPAIHEDKFALHLIGMDGVEHLRADLERRNIAHLARVSAYFAMRHRFCEDRLENALARGITQIVLLGAGLDTLALRRPALARRTVFVEVDHPATQAWKLDRLTTLGLRTPGVRYVPVDFATQDLSAELEGAGVHRTKATFFAWLGVTQYIPEQATVDTLSLIARHARGSEIVFDVIRPFGGLSPEEFAISEAARVSSAARGEPWISYFVPEELGARLAALGFRSFTHLTATAAEPYYAGQPAGVTPLSAWELVAASN